MKVIDWGNDLYAVILDKPDILGDHFVWVDLGGRAEYPCHCGDRVWRERECKHIKAVKNHIRGGATSE